MKLKDCYLVCSSPPLSLKYRGKCEHHLTHPTGGSKRGKVTLIASALQDNLHTPCLFSRVLYIKAS
jgi:hypothetical protein